MGNFESGIDSAFIGKTPGHLATASVNLFTSSAVAGKELFVLLWLKQKMIRRWYGAAQLFFCKSVKG